MRDQFPGLALGFAVVISNLASAASPPPEQTTSQWADDVRMISGESGARLTGRWRTDTAPYLRRPQDVSDVEHPSASVWVRWSAKTGKTQLFLNTAFKTIDTAPRSIMVVTATDQKQKDFEREIWGPAVRATEQVNRKIMPVKSRNGDGSTTYHKRFRGGFLKIVNGGSEPQLQQSDIGLLIFEEPSSYEADVGGRGSPIVQARTRTLAWGDDAKELGGGTPAFVGDCVVTDNVKAGTLERYYVPCPFCRHRQVLLWENMKRVEGRPVFVCLNEACGRLIGEEHREWMNAEAAKDGEPWHGWVPCFESENPGNPAPPPCIAPADVARWQSRDLEGRDPSFDGIWQAYSPFSTWGRIFREFDQAKASGDPEKMVTFVQQVLGQPFEALHERPATQALFENREAAARIAGVTRGRIPSWAWAIFLVADVQGDRIEWAVYAAGPGSRRARIDRGVIPIPPVDPRAWSELSLISQRTYEGPNCKPLGFDRIGVDTGGHHTSQAYVWAAGRPNTMALKGKPNDRDALPLEAGKRRQAKIGRRVVATLQLYLVGTHKLKKDVYHGFAQTLAGVEQGEHLPGSITFEPDASEIDFAQATAEVLLPPDPAKKRKEEAWERSPKGAPNEQLDLAVYAMALEYSFVRNDEDWESLRKARWRDPVELTALPLETLWSPKADATSPQQAPASPQKAGATSPAPPPPQAGPGPKPANPVREPETQALSPAAEALLRLARSGGN